MRGDIANLHQPFTRLGPNMDDPEWIEQDGVVRKGRPRRTCPCARSPCFLRKPRNPFRRHHRFVHSPCDDSYHIAQPSEKMNMLAPERVKDLINLFAAGVGVRAASRKTGVHRDTVSRYRRAWIEMGYGERADPPPTGTDGQQGNQT